MFYKIKNKLFMLWIFYSISIDYSTTTILQKDFKQFLIINLLTTSSDDRYK